MSKTELKADELKAYLMELKAALVVAHAAASPRWLRNAERLANNIASAAKSNDSLGIVSEQVEDMLVVMHAQEEYMRRVESISTGLVDKLVPLLDKLAPKMPSEALQVMLLVLETHQLWLAATVPLLNSLQSEPRIMQRAIAIANRRRAMEGGFTKSLRDPKAAAKRGALELWQARARGERKDLRTVEQFAIEVMRRYSELKSAKVICGWSAKWSKDVKEGRTPSC